MLIDWEGPQAQPTAQDKLKEEEIEEAPQEISILNPEKEQAIFALHPGDARLVRFSFRNDSRQPRMYVMNYDHALPDDWITLVKEQVHIGENGEGEVCFRITIPFLSEAEKKEQVKRGIPSNAEPGEYPFSVSVGPMDGVLTPRSLTVVVLATPIVQITTKSRSVVAGPFGSAVDFALTVENAGNADTAFRIAVQAPLKPVAPGEPTPEPTLIYDTPKWLYLFDKEMDTTRVPAAGRKIVPPSIRLRLQRRGIWWLGWKESHSVQVAAVPVTEPNNSGYKGNTYDLTATRWRLLPVPLVVLIPMLLVMAYVFSSKPAQLRVTSQYYLAEDGKYWITKSADGESVGGNKTIDLEWDAPRLALLRLSGSSDNHPRFSRLTMWRGYDREIFAVDSGERRSIVTYGVHGLFGGGSDITLNCIYTKPDAPLAIVANDNSNFSEKPHVTAKGLEMTLDVPKGGRATLTMINRTTVPVRLTYWVARRLPKPDDPKTGDSNFYQENDFLDGTLNPQKMNWNPEKDNDVNTWERADFVFRGKPDGKVGATDYVAFATTDSNRPIVIVHLKLVEGGN